VWVVGVEASYKGVVGGVVHALPPILVHVHRQKVTRLKKMHKIDAVLSMRTAVGMESQMTARGLEEACVSMGLRGWEAADL
jgi:hypothetical protein